MLKVYYKVDAILILMYELNLSQSFYQIKFELCFIFLGVCNNIQVQLVFSFIVIVRDM